jgi:hypothetical protein
LTVIGFTKLRGFFSLKGKLKPFLASSLGAGTCFSSLFGSYYPGATLNVGSNSYSTGRILNLSVFDMKPLP